MNVVNKKVFIIIMFIAFAIGIYIRSSYAFFNTSYDTTSTVLLPVTAYNNYTSYIRLNYFSDGKYQFIKSSFIAGATTTKSVLITNRFNISKTFLIKFVNVTNNFVTATDLTYGIICAPYVNYAEGTSAINTSCSDAPASGTVPIASDTQIYSTTIKPGQSHLITITLTVNAAWVSNTTDDFLGYVVVTQ